MAVVVLWWWLIDGGRGRTWGRRRRLFNFWRCGLRECKAAGKSNHRSLGQVPALADFPQHTRSGWSGPRRAPGGWPSATRRKTRARPTCPPVFFPSARGRELSLGENGVEIKRARIGRAVTHFSHWVHRFHKRGCLRFCPGNGRTPAWIHVHVGEAGPLHARSRPAS